MRGRYTGARHRLGTSCPQTNSSSSRADGARIAQPHHLCSTCPLRGTQCRMRKKGIGALATRPDRQDAGPPHSLRMPTCARLLQDHAPRLVWIAPIGQHMRPSLRARAGLRIPEAYPVSPWRRRQARHGRLPNRHAN
eukprot:scaffold106501_cov30-Tisochrysis_lutea.AAC.2